MTDYALEVFQNEYLAQGATTIDAIVTITAGGWTPSGSGRAAEILILDTSGSMETPPGRIRAARQAACEAIDAIRDGVLFAVLSGTERCTTIFPVWGAGLVEADANSRAAAREAVRRMQVGGGTAMSTWLQAAHQLFTASPADIRHAILLTDGENREDRWRLDEALRACAGVFQADCRGIGTDWVVDELRSIASALMGTVDIIPEPELLPAEFRRLMERSMGRGVASSALRVWCPLNARVNFVRQVSPSIEDLTGHEVQVDERTRQYPLGAWGAEARDYHLSISVPPQEVGVEMLAARVSLVMDDEVVGPGLVRAIWTDDEIASARVNREVAHYTGQAALAEDIQVGLAALKEGDERTATFRLGRATKLAVASGHEGTVQLLRKVVHVEDAREGTVRLRPRVAKSDEMALDTRSTRTVRVLRPGAGSGGPAPGAGAGAGAGMPAGGVAGGAVSPWPAAGPPPPAAPGDHDDMALDTRSTRTVRVGGRRPADQGGGAVS
ncbi:MAG TPA: VWA domain-containing protein [Acidimicrobiales bacterium]